MLDQLLSVLVTPAHADTAVPAAAQQGGGISLTIMFVMFFVFVYFVIWRPQNKREREVRSMLGALAKGDEVTTIGGLVGRIVKIGDQFITLAVNGNVEIVLQKSSVASVLPKGTIKSLE